MNAKELQALWNILIEQMGDLGHGFKAEELIFQTLFTEHFWTLLLEPVNITALTNFSCSVFPEIYISYCKLVEGRSLLFCMLSSLTVLNMSEMTTRELLDFCYSF